MTGLLVMTAERRAVLLERIESFGVQLFVACGIAEACEVLRARRLDLVFTDCVFSDGDWRDIVADRTQSKLSFEVILCTQRLEGRLCSEAFTRGVWDIIAEPYSSEELRRAIDSAVSRTYMHSLGGARGGAAARAAF